MSYFAPLEYSSQDRGGDRGTRTISDFHQHGDGERRDLRSEPGQQLGDGDIEAGEVITLESQRLREAPRKRGFPAAR